MMQQRSDAGALTPADTIRELLAATLTLCLQVGEEAVAEHVLDALRELCADPADGLAQCEAHGGFE